MIVESPAREVYFKEAIKAEYRLMTQTEFEKVRFV
jgi:hypothetical protein